MSPRASPGRPPVQRDAAFTPPLWRQLQLAAQVLRQVGAGQSLGDLLPRVQATLRPGVQALVFHALRRWGRAGALTRQLVPRAPVPDAAALLGLALALLIPATAVSEWPGDDAPPMPYAPHVLVDQAVEAARRHPRLQRLAGLINAALRRWLRDGPTLWAATSADPQALWNHPAWWIDTLRRDHPQHWPAILASAQNPAPMTLRVDERPGHSRDTCRQRLAAAGIDSQPVGAVGLTLARAVGVDRLPGFAEGEISVQDEAAQLAAPLLLDALPPSGRAPRLLDACAAPGGKTGHLLAMRPDAQLLAIDRDAGRAQRIDDNLRRLRAHAEVRVADAAQPADWWDSQLYDGILLDAPCSASGIVRRHPDVRWLRRASDLPQLAAQQDRLLQALWPLLRPGGALLYATCSVFRIEGDARIAAFVACHPDAQPLSSPGHILPAGVPGLASDVDNRPGGHDGFFYALLRKSASSVA